MFLIRRIHDNTLPINQTALREVQEIFASQFADAPQEDILSLPDRLNNPFLKRFRTVLLVAENARHKVLGFAILLHEPEIEFSYLDFLAIGKTRSGRGIGAALYEHVREQSRSLGSKGLFFECLPAEPELCADATQRKLNAARLKFYETFGVRKLIGTQYESPVPGGSTDSLPHLMYDDLETQKKPKAAFVQNVVKAILERKYRDICPDEYVKHVVDSITSDPVELGEFQYLKPDAVPKSNLSGKKATVTKSSATKSSATKSTTTKASSTKSSANTSISGKSSSGKSSSGKSSSGKSSSGEKPPVKFKPFMMVINDKHDIHHIRERGYVESPVRISIIESELTRHQLVTTIPAREYPLKHLRAVHDSGLVDYLEKACKLAPEGKSVYPYVFPIRNATRPPKEMSVRAGYYCIDTFTPIHRNAFPAAKRAVDATLTAADAILEGHRLAYALVRPPGHHAERKSFGGFCYFCNAAVAANYFSSFGKVAILDIDYHHGNGQQDIFYDRKDVLTISIHGDPSFAYPYFTGFTDETGEGEGLGYNLNLALPEKQDGRQYRKALTKALDSIRNFVPKFLVVSFGLDPAKGDPTGTWSLSADDFTANGELIGKLNLPTLVVQEGGYRTRTLGVNAKSFFTGLLNTQDRE